MTIINLKNVNLTRNKKEILKDITWKVNPGENWVILGLNGSGKSSLLKLILAEEWKTSGEITVLNTQFGNGEIPKLRKRISVVGSFIAERFQILRLKTLFILGNLIRACSINPTQIRNLMRPVSF